MFVVPFFLRDSPPSLISWKLKPVYLFLENHGKQVCFVENPKLWLEENNFVTKESWILEDTFFAEIDTQKTNLKDFYSFEQLTTEQKKGTEECWRTFFLMKCVDIQEKQSEKAWNENLENPFSKILADIQKIKSL